MQLMPGTARRFGVRDRYHPMQNLRSGMSYLGWLLSYFRGDVRLVLAAYNAGERAVERHGGSPPYIETQNYIKKVMRREVNDQRGITKITVLETAPLPVEPIWPDYGRDAGIGLGASMALGIVMVLRFDFFTKPTRMPRREPLPEPAFPNATLAPTLEAHPVTEAVSFQPETTTLDADEIAALTCGDFDMVMGIVTVPSQRPRPNDQIAG